MRNSEVVDNQMVPQLYIMSDPKISIKYSLNFDKIISQIEQR